MQRGGQQSPCLVSLWGAGRAPSPCGVGPVSLCPHRASGVQDRTGEVFHINRCGAVQMIPVFSSLEHCLYRGPTRPSPKPGRILCPTGLGRVGREHGSIRPYNRAQAMEQQLTKTAPDVALPRRSSTEEPPPPPAQVGTKKGNTRPKAAGLPGPTEHSLTCTADMLHPAHGVLMGPRVAPCGPIHPRPRSAPPSDVGGSANQRNTAHASVAMPGPLTGGGPCRLGPRVCTGAPPS
ncbi:hypothetical protein NDU88_004874 [Pleurodeles waltl]|uniref:Uncharacterized protein n=1 Tax=Pleurodeles waltl TaxID=8319 RepID=A0AAV7TTV4_PLEWA|nr:hypothetical protein NDU88_004874 [Pleurodeles waltl]